MLPIAPANGIRSQHRRHVQRFGGLCKAQSEEADLFLFRIGLR